jgi:anti-sigma-K factor RskA
MNSQTLDPNRLEALAAGFALGDLSESEMNEWNRAKNSETERLGLRYDEVASRLFWSFQDRRLEPMPADLTQRLKRMAADLSAPLVTARNEESGMRPREILAWLAMAAGIAFASCAWLPNWDAKAIRIASAGLSDERQSLLASAGDLIQSKWEATAPAASPSTDLGDVIWSQASQKGFMRINGLPKNDPTKEQYQLWIIDPSRDDKPVDGGVFDIAQDGESIIAIDAKLRVGTPTLFAITVEKPGGVVVSDQKRLPLLAKVVSASL